MCWEHVVFVCVPHTKDCEDLTGPAQFQAMKRGSYFIALSRSKLYDMPSVVKALDSKLLAGAGVDVTEPEPLPRACALEVRQRHHQSARSDSGRARRPAQGEGLQGERRPLRGRGALDQRGGHA